MASVNRIIARRTAAKRNAARRSEVRRMIIEQSRIERRKNIITLVTIFLFVAAAAFFLRHYAGQIQFSLFTNEQISYGNPNSLSYSMYEPPKAVLERMTGLATHAASCESFGPLKCEEPTVRSFSLKDNSEYVQEIYMTIRNSGSASVSIQSMEFTADNTPCNYMDGSNYNITAGQASLVRLVCIYEKPAPSPSASVIIYYLDGRTGYMLTSGVSLKPQ
jgi:hypothetical protein